MEFLVDGVGSKETPIINLKADHENFKVTLIAIPSADFDGTWGVKYSPNGIVWFDHEDLKNKTGNLTGNMFFPVPYVKFIVTGGTMGKAAFYAFGSVI